MELLPNEKIDWFRIIVNLCNAGHSMRTIGIEVGVTKSTIRDWKAGATPRFEDGLKLINLWHKTMNPPAPPVNKLPTVDRYSHRA